MTTEAFYWYTKVQNEQEEAARRADALKETADVALFSQLKPQTGKEGEQFFILSGGDLQSGICGFGNTFLDAIQDWAKNIRHEKIKNFKTKE